MPEGDTVWRSANRLHLALADGPVTTFDLRVPQWATADLRGDSITQVLARGKHILMRFAGGSTLHTHLRMDGSWRIAPAVGPTGIPRGDEHQVRALIGTRQWVAIGLRVHDVVLLPSTDEASLVGHLGPDLLGPDWDPGAAVARLRSQPASAIGDALLDQRNLAGIGNLYKAEILFIHGLNPWTPVGAVDDLDRVVDTAHRLLRRNRDHPEQSTTGSLRRGEQHRVYLRSGQPCRRCGAVIVHARQGIAPRDRETWWCPRCQPNQELASGEA
jgi:endonuclease VIII